MTELSTIGAIVKDDGGEAPHNNSRGWREFAALINGAWRKGAGALLEAGRYLIQAKEELDRDEYNSLVKLRLEFDTSTAKKLICIGQNKFLGAHVHRLPPCWSTLYELSKLEDEVLETAIANGSVNPKMQRKDAIALRKPPKDETEGSEKSGESPPPEPKLSFAAAWDAASDEEIRAKLDKAGRDGVCKVMSENLKAELRDHILGLTIDAASKTPSFAVSATNKLHTAMRCAEVPDPDHEARGHLLGAVKWIAQAAERRNIARSNIVIAVADPRAKHRNKK